MGSTTGTAWKMAGIASVLQNWGVVTSIVAYGAALATIEHDLATTRAMASIATSLQLLALGLMSPVVGILLQRVPLRVLLVAGVALGAAGSLVVAFAPHIYWVLAAYALLIGPSSCILGPVTVATLVSRWFDKDRGTALSLANVPIFLLVVPPGAAWLIEAGGRPLLFGVLAAGYLLLLPLIAMVRERPDAVAALAVAADDVVPMPQPSAILTNGQLLARWRFWVLNLGVGVLTGSGVAYTTHGYQIIADKGIDLTLAASVLSAYGLGTVLGVFVFGWLIDRIGALPSLVLGGGILAGLWIAFGLVLQLQPLYLISGLFGATMGSVVAMHGAAITELFGPANVSRAMGLAYFLKIPFLFGFPYLLGKLHDMQHDYVMSLVITAVLVAVAAAMFTILALASRGGKDSDSHALGATLR